jgi:putative endonuclease
MKKNNLGYSGEKLVQRYYENRSYNIIAINYHSRYGEIDIIAEKDNWLHIIEVKSRNNNFNSAISSITRKKQSKIVKTALHFLSKNFDYSNHYISFDVAIVNYFPSKGHSEITIIENAFDASESNSV